MLWAQANPDGAITFARGYPSLGISEQLITSAALKICAQERSRGLAVLLDFPAGRARTGALKSLFADWAKREPSAAFASASQIETGEARDQSMGAVLTTWAATDASAALEGYQAAGINDATVLANVLTGLVEKNPATVVAVLENLPPYDFQRCGSRVLGAWARHDPATALTWAFERGLSLGGTMEVESSIEHLSSRRIYTTKEWNIDSPLSTAFASKPDATLAWLESLPAGADRDEVYELAIGASRDAGAVLELFSQMQPDAAARAAFKIGSRFAADPHVSKRWIESLPPGRVRQQAFAGFGLSGYGDEPARLDDRDAWLSGRSQMMNWQAGLKETAKISDPSLRRDMFEVFFQKHFPYFRGTSEERNEAVNKVMEDAGLSEEAKRRLLD